MAAANGHGKEGAALLLEASYERRRIMTRNRFRLQACLLASVAMLGVVVSGWADSPEPTSATQQQVVTNGEEQSTVVSTAAVAPAARMVFIDPATGRIISQQEAAEIGQAIPLSAGLANALSRSSDGLYEVPGPDGGWMVDLHGRFRSATVATIDADGSLRVGRVDSAPALAEVPDEAQADTDRNLQEGGAEQ
jgi:hypothetical protein